MNVNEWICQEYLHERNSLLVKSFIFKAEIAKIMISSFITEETSMGITQQF